MSKKLTLNINKAIIEQAKGYAKEHQISLSQLIENYLQALTTEDNKESEDVSPLVKSLTGILPEEADEKLNDDHYNYLTKKYS